MKLLNLDESTLMEVSALEREGNNLVVKGTILGTMPVTCMLTPREGRGVLKLVSFRLLLFLMTFLFRR